MDQIFLIVVLVVGGPLVAGIWLIARAISAKNRIDELARRVDELQVQLVHLRNSPPAAPKSVEEKIAGFMPATLPPRKSETETFTPPPPEIPPAAEPISPPPLIPEMRVPPETIEIPLAVPICLANHPSRRRRPPRRRSRHLPG